MPNSDDPIYHPEKTEAALRARYDALVDYKGFSFDNYRWCLDQLSISMRATDTVLDVGCGRGTFCHFVARTFGANAIGVDYSLPRIQKARALADKNGHARFLHQRLQDYFAEYPNVTFDYIASFEVFEHLEDPYTQLELCKQRATVVLGSLPLAHPSVSHIWDFPTMASLREFLGPATLLVPKPDSYRVFFRTPGHR